MHCGKKWWIREFVAPYIFSLNSDYVAARSLRSLRSNDVAFSLSDSGSLWRVLLFVVFILRFVKTATPTLLSFPNIRSHPAPFFVQIFCRTIRESFQYFQVAKVSDLIFLFSRFNKTTVLCCRILTFWSNLALNIVSTARNDLCFTLCFGSHLKSPGNSGSARLPRGMKLGNPPWFIDVFFAPKYSQPIRAEQWQVRTLENAVKANIARNAYCSRDIYFQFNKVRRSVILRAIMQRLYESASAIGCQECSTKLINMLLSLIHIWRCRRRG